MAPLVTPATNVSMSPRESARPSRLQAMMSTKGIGPKYTGLGTQGPGLSGFVVRDQRAGAAFESRTPNPESRIPSPEPRYRVPLESIRDAAATHRADGHRAKHAPGRL